MSEDYRELNRNGWAYLVQQGCESTLPYGPEQLQRDREVAQHYCFDIECLEGDMLDLSALYGREFDLVYQPVSALYVPDVPLLYREVFRVPKPGGLYWIEHWNPVQM